jgi:hypothetical protein
MRAALLPAVGGPAIARYWCRNYEATWRGEVDELIVLCQPWAAKVYAAVGARLIVTDRMGHGEALDRLIQATSADVVVLVEDDAYVRHRGVISERLDRLAEDDLIGCPRGGMDPAIAEAAMRRWGPVIGPDTSYGHGLWPCFLFARTADLLDAGSCASRTWHGGEQIPGLDYAVPSPMTTDTMTAAAFQLRSRLRITPEVQYKELWQKEYHGGEPWFHAGGLSTDPASARPGIGMDNLEGRDWAHRFWWWRRIGHDYREHWERAGVDPDWWNDTLEPWINWDE